MDIRRQVGLNVRRIRKEHDWSQEEFAFETELHRTYISGIERGIRNPTVLIIAKLASALGVQPMDLLKPVGKTGTKNS
ncbi:MAG: helix-turn-helix transcriptional regulator [Alphaproteobacteria bacterium]|jgi:transcriptional regulator with XRE-family HTH domain|nr:helix-turn-helix transcriptional regulator [Alphaproteobacteria bacterium]MBT4083551.1 helix-turn-helix transcriptional regulator [Alphaproteobacteria bacterium]MBT4546676.1 helix-turn-helix transcriptional regulator [Alphaproteobacteria bacterium]MBT7747507.1 helix-turn-helix transcriptional regulator [Alphaproteobacteria bacterium]